MTSKTVKKTRAKVAPKKMVAKKVMAQTVTDKKAPMKKATVKPGKGTAKKAAKKPVAEPVEAGTQHPEGDELRAAGGALNARQAIFVREFLIPLTAPRPLIRAGYSARSARQSASEIMANPAVAAAIEAGQAERAAKLELKAEMVIGRLRDIAFADARELCGLHRYGCRYCWGKGNRFQRTESNMESARLDHARAQEADHSGAFDEQGGVGFNGKASINPACPECFGDGVERVYFADTSKLSPSGAALFAGIKTTKDGMEYKVHDQLSALVTLARHLGLLNDKLKVDANVKHDATDELREFLTNRGSRLPIRTE